MNISGNEVTGLASPDTMFQMVGLLGVCFIIGAVIYAVWSMMK